MSLQQCELLIKGHLKSLDDQVYQSDDPEVVIKHYLPFLCGCAQYTRRLNSSVVQQAVQSILGVPSHIGKKFGDAMASSLKYCNDKGKSAMSGKKLSASVKSVILSFKDADSALAALQSALGGKHSSSSSSSHQTPPGALPAPSPPSLPVKRTHEQQDKKEEDNDDDAMEKKHTVDDARAIYSIYGVSPPAKKRPKITHEVLDVVSSQEAVASLPSQASMIMVETSQPDQETAVEPASEPAVAPAPSKVV